MADDAETPNEPTIENDPDGYGLNDFVSKDWALDLLLDEMFGHLDQNQDTSFSITLNVGGVIVSGLAIPSDAWAGLFASRLSEAHQQSGEVFQELWNRFRADTKEKMKDRDAEGLPVLARRYIHLRDARVFSGAGVLEMGLWRGLVEEVSGWSIGTPDIL